VRDSKICIVGLDIYESRIDELNNVYDRTLELNERQLKEADEIEVKSEYNLELNNDIDYDDYEAVVMAVSHDNTKQVVYDIKSVLKNSDGRL